MDASRHSPELQGVITSMHTGRSIGVHRFLSSGIVNEAGRFVEIQGTAEGHAFSRDEFNALIALAAQGIGQIIAAQTKAITGESRS